MKLALRSSFTPVSHGLRTYVLSGPRDHVDNGEPHIVDAVGRGTQSQGDRIDHQYYDEANESGLDF